MGSVGKVLTVAAAAIALQATAVNAKTLMWSYSGPGNSGGGTFDATLQGDGSYLLDGVHGVANGQTITGLDDFDGSDNVVFPPSPPNIGVDTLGIAFDAGGIAYNLYEDDGNFNPDSEFACGAVYCLITSESPTIALDSFTVTVVPEPATWAMMVLGLGALGAALRSRRRPAGALA